MGRLYELWCTILDIIGPRDKWPRNIPGLFWKVGTLKNQERFVLTTFCYINGLGPELLLEWCTIRRLLRDVAAVNHIKYLYDKYENSDVYDHKYWQWNVALGVGQYIGGAIHYY